LGAGRKFGADDFLAGGGTLQLGWLEFDWVRWVETGEERVVECFRTYKRELLGEAREWGAGAQRANELTKLQNAEQIGAAAGVWLC